MGNLGFGEVVLLLVMLVIWIPPAIMILRRAGFHAAWAVVLLIPIFNIVGLWIFAFSEWPSLKNNS